MELYPTHPFRTPGLLDSLTEKLLAGYSEVSTVKAVSIHPQAFATTDAQGRLCTLPEPDAGSGGHAYRRYGQFHGWRLESHPAARYRGYAHVITNPVELVDIDYLADFYLAEYLISNNLYDFR